MKILPNVSIKVQRNIAMALVQIFCNQNTFNYKLVWAIVQMRVRISARAWIYATL